MFEINMTQRKRALITLGMMLFIGAIYAELLFEDKESFRELRERRINETVLVLHKAKRLANAHATYTKEPGVPPAFSLDQLIKADLASSSDVIDGTTISTEKRDEGWVLTLRSARIDRIMCGFFAHDEVIERGPSGFVLESCQDEEATFLLIGS